MKRSAALLVLLVAAWPLGALAQPQQLTDQQRHGRQLLTQNCNVCHLPQDPGAKTYGPHLDKSAANGDDSLMKEVIQNGLVRMPGWKYTLKDSDISDIIAYVRTLPVPETAAAPR